MSLYKRAFLYITRKITKSLLLFLIILVISTLVFSGAAIKDAAKTAQLNIRQALGGMFTMEQNTSDPSRWENREVTGFGYQAWYEGTPLTEELADTVMSKVNGINGYNATATNYLVAANKSGDNLTLLESEEDSMSASAFAGFGDFGSTMSTYASTNTEFDSYFAGGYLELVEGRHVTSKDKNAVLISKDLADLNNLHVGDIIDLHMSEFKASMAGLNADDTRMDAEIVGLFHSTAKSSSALSNWSMDNSLFTTMNVVNYVRSDKPMESYERIHFHVNDPGELESIVESIRELPEIDPDEFIIKVDNSSVEAVDEPMQNMGHLITILIWLVIAVGAVILYLVLSGRIKERIHESGILLSIGLKKRNIVAQYLVEVFMIALISFTISIFTSNLIANGIGNVLLDYSNSNNTKVASDKTDNTIDGVTTMDSSDFQPDFQAPAKFTTIDVSISPATIVIMFAIGLLLISISVLLAALPVLRLKPREIMSKMS